VFCYDLVRNPPVRHPMACIGYEKDREALKYRCPARHELVVHLGLATRLASAPRWEGTLGGLRLSPIAQALQAEGKTESPPEPRRAG
jgi:hypothetical protein